VNAHHPHIVLAPDKFKGTLTADQVASAMALGCGDAGLENSCITMPIADGGDGSVGTALRTGWSRREIRCTDAWGQPSTTTVAISDTQALIEIAAICGLRGSRPSSAQALVATSRGVGEVITRLLDLGFRDITLALGGSATTDGGAGMLVALGAQLRDRTGAPVALNALGLQDLSSVCIDGLDPRLKTTTLTVACDVDVPLAGPRGAAATFGPQKGADEQGVRTLTAALDQLAAVAGPAFGRPDEHLRPGAGAAGGLAWAGLLLGAHMRRGAELFLDMLGASETIEGAALVLTGEGRMDDQSALGKGPFAVAALASKLSVPSAAIVGTNRLNDHGLNSPFTAVTALDSIDPLCSSDPALSARLIRQATAALIHQVRRELPIFPD
jgi:glycerate kinase